MEPEELYVMIDRNTFQIRMYVDGDVVIENLDNGEVTEFNKAEFEKIIKSRKALMEVK